MRLFLAFEVPPRVRAAVAERLAAVRDGLPAARWVPKANLHLTLVFLGDTAREAILPLGQRLRSHLADLPRPPDAAPTGGSLPPRPPRESHLDRSRGPSRPSADPTGRSRGLRGGDRVRDRGSAVSSSSDRCPLSAALVS